jgi:uncharacterized protein YggU (UPF0235/DUF167 family)
LRLAYILSFAKIKTELIKTEAGYKACIQCPPVDGKANEALIMLLSEEFGVAKNSIYLLKAGNETIKVTVR